MDQGWTECYEPWERLKWARKQAFKSAAAAARSLPLAEGTYRAYERPDTESKHTRLDHQRAIQFGRKFKVDWEWLLTGSGTPAPKGLTEQQDRVVKAMAEKSEAEQERIARAIEALLKAG